MSALYFPALWVSAGLVLTGIVSPLPAQKMIFVPVTQSLYPSECGNLLFCTNMYFLLLKTFPNASGLCREIACFLFFPSQMTDGFVLCPQEKTT